MTAPGPVQVVVDTPQHSNLSGPLDYASERALTPGALLRVPLGKRQVLGIVWHALPTNQKLPDGKVLRPVIEAFDALSPLPAAWLALVDFAAAYYQRGTGELALSVLPPELRKLTAATLAKRLARLDKRLATSADAAALQGAAPAPTQRPELSAEQQHAFDAIEGLRLQSQPTPVLLHGVTGSGKTEVYLRATEAVLAAGRQVLVLVPEINLTPQLEARFAQRFPAHQLVAMHSGLTPAQRLSHWLQATLGRADIVLGTRLSVFAPLPDLGLIVVDEEHDPSYKQQEGARYSARDLAVYRAHLERIPVILGSATPSLESWQRAEQGRYLRLTLAQRVGDGPLPRVRLFDMGVLPRVKGAAPVLAPAVLQSLRERIERGEQSLVFLNRRG